MNPSERIKEIDASQEERWEIMKDLPADWPYESWREAEYVLAELLAIAKQWQETLERVEVYLSGDHRTKGEGCGVGLCALCGAEGAVSVALGGNL